MLDEKVRGVHYAKKEEAYKPKLYKCWEHTYMHTYIHTDLMEDES